MLRYKKIALAVYGFTIFLFSFFMINQLTNVGDGFWQQSYYLAGDVEVSSGRWLWPYLDKVLGGNHVDPLTTLVSIMLFVAGFTLALATLNIKPKFVYCVIGGLITFSSPVFSSVLAYKYMSVTFALAMFLSALAALLCFKIKNNVVAVIVPSVILSMSMGLYQSYIGVFCVTGLLFIIRLLMDDKNEIYRSTGGLYAQMGFPMIFLAGMMFVLSADIFDFSKSPAPRYVFYLVSAIAVVSVYGQALQTLTDHSAMQEGYIACKSMAAGVLDDLRRKYLLHEDRNYFFIGSPVGNGTFHVTDAYWLSNHYARTGSFWLIDRNMYATYSVLFQRVMGVDLHVMNDIYEQTAYDEYYKSVPSYSNEGYIIDWQTVIIIISEP